MAHDDQKIGFFEGKFLKSFLIFGGFALEDDLHGLGGNALLGLDLLLQDGDLSSAGGTLAEGSTSTEKISPLRFLRLIFMRTLYKRF